MWYGLCLFHGPGRFVSLAGGGDSVKRPGRHKKNRNKHEKRMGKYRGKGKKGR